MLQIIKTLFNSWNDNGIVYCHWKGNGHLEDSMTGKSDFDILISDESLEKGCELLNNAGYRHFNTQKGARFPGIQDWIGVDEETGTMIHIHLHLKMIAGHSGVMEYILPWNDLAFSTRIYDDEAGLFLINPNLEIILLYTRFGIEKSTKKLKKVEGGWILKDKTREEVLYLKQRLDMKVCREMAKALFPDCYEKLCEYVEKDELAPRDVSDLGSMLECACGQWRRYSKVKVSLLKRMSKFDRQIRSKFYEGTLRGVYKKTPITGKGLTIAFIGKDGSGRTMLAHDLLKWLTWKLDANYIYTGSCDFTPPYHNPHYQQVTKDNIQNVLKKLVA